MLVPGLFPALCWSCGREAEGGGLLNRYTVEKPYRGFESLRLLHHIYHYNIKYLAQMYAHW